MNKSPEQRSSGKSLLVPPIILVVEPESGLRKAISHMLRSEGSLVFAVATGSIALEIARENPLSLIFLDGQHLQEPLLDFCQQLRTYRENIQVPILLVISSKQEMIHRERQGIHANEYLVSPFKWEELRACVQTLLRSEKQQSKLRFPKIERTDEGACFDQEQAQFCVEDLSVDIARRTVTLHGRPIKLTSALLFDLLAYFVRHPGIVVTREHLLQNVWRYDSLSTRSMSVRTVDVHVHWLRELLGDDSAHPQIIQTVRGIGYRLKTP